MPNAFNAQSRVPDCIEALWWNGTRGAPNATVPPQNNDAVNMQAPGYPFTDHQWPTSRQTNAQRDLMLLGIAVTPRMKIGASITATPWDAETLVGNEVRAGQIPLLVMSGFTKTGAGAALGLCTVSVWRWNDDVATDGVLFARKTSDAGGAFSFDLPPGKYEFEGFLASPYLVGSTRYDVAAPSSSVSIYMRDPTAADSAGGVVGGFKLTPASPRRRS